MSPEQHPGREALASFLRGELAPQERRRVVRHLLTGCARCLEVTRPFWALPEERAEDGAGERGLVHPSSYRGVFERVLQAGRRREQELAAEREEAPRLCAELLQHPRGQRLAAAHAGERFHTPSVGELLVLKGRQASRDDPAVAAEMAEIAIAIAERLDRRACGDAVALALEARSWACLGEARRMAGDLAGAERALQVADTLLRDLPPDARQRGELLCLMAALAGDRRRFDEAERLLDRALAQYRAAGEPRLEGRALAQKGLVLAAAGRRQAAIQLLRDGVGLLDEHGEPHLLAFSLCRLVELLSDEGRGGEALMFLQRAKPLYGRLGDRQHLARLRWLEGKVGLLLDRPEAAEQALLEARWALLAEGLGREAALVCLDLATFWARQDRWDEIRRLGEEIFPIFRARDMRREAMAALLVFRRAIENRSATVELFVEVARYLVGLRRNLFACFG